jgi:hypothetical protein
MYRLKENYREAIDKFFAAQACPPCEQGETGGVARQKGLRPSAVNKKII